MDKDKLEKMNRAKAWCFDNDVTEEEVEKAWNNAIALGVPVIVNLNKHGNEWWILAPHLLRQLMDRYSD